MELSPRLGDIFGWLLTWKILWRSGTLFPSMCPTVTPPSDNTLVGVAKIMAGGSAGNPCLSPWMKTTNLLRRNRKSDQTQKRATILKPLLNLLNLLDSCFCFKTSSVNITTIFFPSPLQTLFLLFTSYITCSTLLPTRSSLVGMRPWQSPHQIQKELSENKSLKKEERK